MRLTIATWFPTDPSRPRGGVEAVSVVLVRALAQKQELEVEVVTFDASVPETNVQEWEGAKIHRLPRGRKALLPFAVGSGGRQLAEYINSLRPDLIHAHDTYGIMLRRWRPANILTIHGYIHEDTRYRGRILDRVRAYFWKHEEVSAWRNTPHIVAISPYVRERLRGINRTIHDVENPIDERCFKVEHVDAGLRVFSSAVINPRKNTLALVEAFARADVRDVHLRLAGPITNPAYGESVRAYIRQHGLEQRVHLLGSLPSTEIRDELARATIFALVSLEEGAPMGVAEAMAASLPVLTSNRCGMPYMVRHGESGFLVDPTNAADIARHLRLLLTDVALRQQMRREARASAERMFHPNQVAARTLRVYERAMATH